MYARQPPITRTKDATATDTEPSGEIPVPFSINTRTNTTMCKATKKKIVGGSSAKNSSLSLVDSLVMELNCDESYRFHGSCSRTWLGRMPAAVHRSKAKMVFQSSFMLMTVQPFFFASAMSASENVPIFDSAP